MRFRFRLETVMRQRRVERDTAQRDYSEAQSHVQNQLLKIKKMYDQIDEARANAEKLERQGGPHANQLVQTEEFITGQIILIQQERETARELMMVAEQKLEVLTEKLQAFKILEKLKEKKREEFRKERNRRTDKEIDDLTVMRSSMRESSETGSTQDGNGL